MKIPSSFLTPLKSSLLGLALLGLSLAAAPAARAAGAKAYQFTTSGANTSGSILTLDHPALNGKPKLNLIINHRYVASRNAHPAGLQYDASSGHWQIRNEDAAALPLGEVFNVLVAPGAKRMPVQALTTSNYISYFPTLAKNKPNTNLLATHLINDGQFSGVLLTDPFSTYYTGGLWSIYTDNIAPMKAVAFNIADVTKLKVGHVPASFRVTSTGANTSNDVVFIDNPLTNGHPNAVVFTRHLWLGAYDTSEVGVYYDNVQSMWGIYNENIAAMGSNHNFVVMVVPQPAP